MAAVKLQKITGGKIEAWSFSRWWDYSTCPYKAGLKHVMKIKEPGNKAMERGSDIGKLGEDYLKRKLPASPAEFNEFRKPLQALRTAKAVPEGEWAFDKLWNPVTWYAKNAWARIKIDAFAWTNSRHESADVIDYKTGKIKEHHQLQLGLYAMGSFHKYDTLKTVKTALWYLDHEKTKDVNPAEEIYARKELPLIQKAWDKRLAPMFADSVFKPKPGFHCRFCHFRKNNGGPCTHD